MQNNPFGFYFQERVDDIEPEQTGFVMPSFGDFQSNPFERVYYGEPPEESYFHVRSKY